MLDKNHHYNPWKTFTTVVLHKPGKPHYDVPKAYRPIALLNTMWKVLTTIVADQKPSLRKSISCYRKTISGDVQVAQPLTRCTYSHSGSKPPGARER